MTESRDHDHTVNPLGSIAEEAMKLLDAVQQRVGRELGKGLMKGSLSGFGAAFGAGGDSRTDDVWSEAVTEDPDEEYICRACPICRVKAASRDSGGEIADHLVAAGGELFAALRQAVEALQRPATGGRPREREREPRPSRAEHVDLG